MAILPEEFYQNRCAWTTPRASVDGLREEERKLEDLRQFLDLAPDAMVIVHADGRILAANAAAHTLFRVPREELVGSAIDEFVPGELANAHRRQREEYHARPGRKPMTNRNVEAQLRTGERVAVEVSLAPMDLEGSTCVAASIRDLTEQHERQANLERRRRELERSNKELEQFAYMTLVNSQEIVNKVRRQRDDSVDENEVDDDLFDEVSNSASQMSAVTRRMLNYALVGIGDSTPSPTDLNQALSAALKKLERLTADKKAVITSDKLPRVLGASTSLTQVFRHLLENAIVFAGDEPAEIHVGSRPLGSMTEVYVRDNGIGIDNRHLELIFEMFQRLHSRDVHPSSGMGLATCRKIVEHHNGQIRAESTLGEGTTILFTIPSMPK